MKNVNVECNSCPHVIGCEVYDGSITELVLKVEGNNEIKANMYTETCPPCAIYTDGVKLTIKGDGVDSSVLTLSTTVFNPEDQRDLTNCAIYVMNDFSVDNVKVKATAGDAPNNNFSYGIYSYYACLRLSNADLESRAGTASLSVGMSIMMGDEYTHSIDSSVLTIDGKSCGLEMLGEGGYISMTNPTVNITSTKEIMNEDLSTSHIDPNSVIKVDGEVLTTGDIPHTAKKLEITTSAVAAHNVTYNTNGGTGTAPTQTPVKEGDSFTVAGIGNVTKTGYTFGGWTIDGDTSGKIYKAGDIVKMGTSDITFKAVWEKSPTPSSSDNGIAIAVIFLIAILLVLYVALIGRYD